MAFVIHFGAMHVPLMQGMLGTANVSPLTWLIGVALAVTVVPAMELHKCIWHRRHRARARSE